MKLNRKGYMLIEMILAAVIAMTIAYYLLNLTYKFKNKNEDVYNSAVLITDKILITKNIMSDLEGKIVENVNVSTDKKEVTLTVNGKANKISINRNNNTITYSSDSTTIYSKKIEKSMEIGDITYENKTLSIPITSIYSDTPTNIKIFIKDNSISMFYYTGDVQIYEVPKDGYYKIEAWGAEGGPASQIATLTSGGLGGYTSGYIKLNKNEKLYIYVGAKGSKPNEQPAYNGGGGGGTDESHPTYGGGGATDIRLNNGDWNNANSLKSRIMVAGGGGGSYQYSSSYLAKGGAGGGLIAGSGSATSSKGETITPATGGSQVSGGVGNNNTNTGSSFGIGGTGTGTLKTGGGGGYYGGGGTYNVGYSAESGGGGSSYISGYAGVNSINSDDNTKHYSGKYFVNGEMSAAVREGNGQAKITYIGETYNKDNNPLNDKNNPIRYIKDCVKNNTPKSDNKQWVEIQAIKDGINVAKDKDVIDKDNVIATSVAHSKALITDGDISSNNWVEATVSGTNEICVIVDLKSNYDYLDEIAVWHYYADSRKYNGNSTWVAKDLTNWIKVIKTDNKLENNAGRRANAYPTP